MPRYKAAFEDATIELPQDPEILSDHRMLRMEKGVARVPDRRIAGDDGRMRHGDSAIAGALAWYASKTNHQEYAYTPVGKQLRPQYGPHDDDDDDRRQVHGRRGWLGKRIRFGRGSY
jgi:phage FluMu gp28-like protein